MNFRTLRYGICASALAGLLSACASETPWRVPISSTSGMPAQESAECSLAGRLACRAMAIGSDGQQGTCTASRSGSTYVESCGIGAAAVAAPVAPPPAKAQPTPTPPATGSRSTVQLTWKDNSSNETAFVIERCDQIFRDIRGSRPTVTCRSNWKIIASVLADTTTYVDDTVIAKQTYIYRVKATNQSGSSTYTPEAVITAPEKVVNNAR